MTLLSGNTGGGGTLIIIICHHTGWFFRSARTSWNTFVRPSVRPFVGAKNLDQLYSSINQQRTTANLSDIVWCVSGGVWWCLEHVWWCLVVSDACLVVSGGVNVYRLI